MKNSTTDVARRLGVKADEIETITETDEGLVIKVRGTAVPYIEVADSRPDADGKTGVMYLHRPHPKTAPSFPVYAREKADDADVEEIDDAVVELPEMLDIDPAYQPLVDLIEQAVADGDFPGAAAAVAAIVEKLTAPDDDEDDDEQTGGDTPAIEKPDGRAGLERWVTYATSLGIDVPDGADKDAVRQLVADHEDAAGA